ncbi:hypothetical protein Nther_1039 [Natranaerobius thermophilus JW/NM-WN-LF]|uniref:Uncharacterized protein n=1 Tax=Natranaerobius thermophilus (strain ATCC BAA-1301 / DSM 18059 / JW/NM-WN-LF) TaxID=457570 RepID=B2A100_NATTJ|nr:hypothetical protein Nther_1039 [Natranaerobius thermophilus JW/NM-WN-LF]
MSRINGGATSAPGRLWLARARRKQRERYLKCSVWLFKHIGMSHDC